MVNTNRRDDEAQYQSINQSTLQHPIILTEAVQYRDGQLAKASNRATFHGSGGCAGSLDAGALGAKTAGLAEARGPREPGQHLRGHVCMHESLGDVIVDFGQPKVQRDPVRQRGKELSLAIIVFLAESRVSMSGPIFAMHHRPTSYMHARILSLP